MSNAINNVIPDASNIPYTSGGVSSNNVGSAVKELSDSYTTVNTKVSAITSLNTNNVLESILAGSVTKKSCSNGVVCILGTSPAGSTATLAKIKTAYKPIQTIGAQVYIPSSSDNGKDAQVSVDQATGNIILSASSALNYGVYYNITYSIG